MKRLPLLLLILFLFSESKNCQPSVDFSGYVYNFPIYQRNQEKLSDLFGIEKDLYLDLTRIRLKPAINLWSRARINFEYEINTLYLSSSTTFPITGAGKTNRQLFDLNWQPVNENRFNVHHFIDRFYFRQGFDFGNIVIGRQRIAWGSGRVWNPSDLFNPINPANFFKIEKDGADALSFQYYMGLFTDLQIVFNPMEKFKKSNFGMRFRTNYSEYDISLIGGYFDERIVAGLDFAGNLLDAGIRGEGIYSVNEKISNDSFVKFILGIDYQFTPELYALIEYHYNGEGKTDKLKYEFTRLINGEIINLNKNYLNATINYQVHPLLILTVADNTNLNDGSGYISGSASYSATESLYLNLGSLLPYGKELTEYWYYPESIYLQGEYYF